MRHSFTEFDLFGRSVQGELARRAREAASRKRARLARCTTIGIFDVEESVGRTLETIQNVFVEEITTVCKCTL